MLLFKNKEGELVLQKGLQAFDIDTRTRAVTALCLGLNTQANWLARNDVMEQNISLVREFIEDNITVASQASRNVITKSLSTFFTHLRDYLLHSKLVYSDVFIKNLFLILVLKICKGTKGVVLLNETAATLSITQFFIWVGKFICNGMDLGYSYQRNLFTLQIFDCLLTTFSPSDKSLTVKNLFVMFVPLLYID